MSRAGELPGIWPRWILWIFRILTGMAVLVFLGGASWIALRNYSREVTEYGAVAGALLTTGKVLGLLAGSLLLVQLALAAKLKFLDRIFGFHRLLRFHRSAGLTVVLLASLHPLFVYAPLAKEIGPLRFGIWPELVGVMLLTGLWTGSLLAIFRVFLGLPYGAWYRLHRIGMWGAVLLLAVHAFVVTGDLSGGWPFLALMVFLLAYGVLLAWKKVFKPLALWIRRHTVNRVEAVGKDAYEVELVPKKGKGMRYLPGQFAFVTFRSASLPAEMHPWTISSSPTREESLIFTIKCSGDFTSRIGRLRPGEKAAVDGPFGHFSHRMVAPDPRQHVLMIAGGVGVTPMLSMLRYMADREKARPVTLIWSNRTEKDVFCREELAELQAVMPNLVIHHVLTRERVDHPQKGRLDAQILVDLLSHVSRDSSVFVCGPPSMMKDVCRDLRTIGFPRRHTHTERFSY